MLCAYHMEPDSAGHFGNVETPSSKPKLKLSRKIICSGPCCNFHPNSVKSTLNFFLLRRFMTPKYQTFFSSVMFEKHGTVRKNHTLVSPFGNLVDSGPSLEYSLCLELANIYVRGAWRVRNLIQSGYSLKYNVLIGPDRSLNHLPDTSRINHPNKKIEFPTKWGVRVIDEMTGKRTFSPP